MSVHTVDLDDETEEWNVIYPRARGKNPVTILATFKSFEQACRFANYLNGGNGKKIPFSVPL